ITPEGNGIAVCCVSFGPGRSAPDVGSESVPIGRRDVTLVPMDTDRVIPHMTVEIKAEPITAVLGTAQLDTTSFLFYSSLRSAHCSLLTAHCSLSNSPLRSPHGVQPCSKPPSSARRSPNRNTRNESLTSGWASCEPRTSSRTQTFQSSS